MSYYINPRSKYREERFGGIVESHKSGILALNKKEYKLFLSFRNPRPLNTKQLKRNPFLQELILEKILIEENPC